MIFTTKKLFILLLSALLLASCVFNINTDPECYECSYKHQGTKQTETICDPNISLGDRDDLRDKLRIITDSLNVALTCVEY